MARASFLALCVRGSRAKRDGPWSYFRPDADTGCFAGGHLRRLLDGVNARALPDDAPRPFLRPGTGGVSHSMSRNSWGAFLVFLSACGSSIPGGELFPQRRAAPAALGI